MSLFNGYANRQRGRNAAKITSGGQIRPITILTANTTLGPSDSGGIYFCDAANLVISLPATMAGLIFTFILGPSGLSASVNGLQISPVAADAIYGNGLTSVDNKDLFLAQASDRVGDAVELVGDGRDGYFINSVVGTWTKEA